MVVRSTGFEILHICVIFSVIFPIVVPRFRLDDYARVRKSAKVPPGVSAEDALFLTPYIEKGKIDDAQQLAKVSPLMKNVLSFAGYLTVNKTANSNLFFWLFKSQEGDWTKQPLVAWFQGGPGGTSMFGLFTELGPFYVNKQQKLRRRKYSWNQKFNLVFIDNPVGTGFSFTKMDSAYPENESDVAKDLYEAFVQLYKLFPSLQKNKLIITGQSYAGKYVPVIACKIYQKNKVSPFKINIGGLMIGNPFTDPINQVAYSSYLYKLGLIDKKIESMLMNKEDQIRAEIRAGKWRSAYKDLESQFDTIKEETGLRNINDFVHDNVGVDAEWVGFVNSAPVRKAIHVGNYEFNNGADSYHHLQNDVMQSVKPWVEEMLTSEEFPIMFYSGQLDISIAYPLSLDFYNTLRWPRASEYLKASRCQFKVGTDVAGYYKTAGTFTEMLVRNTGHMVPTTQPKWAYEMLEKFVSNSSYFSCASGK